MNLTNLNRTRHPTCSLPTQLSRSNHVEHMILPSLMAIVISLALHGMQDYWNAPVCESVCACLYVCVCLHLYIFDLKMFFSATACPIDAKL